MIFDKSDVVAALGPLQLEQPGNDDPVVQAYRSYYGIDFETHMPGVTAYLGIVPIVEYQVAVQVFMPANPVGTVWVLHGYYDHVGIFDHLIEYLLGQGYAVVAHDLPGHGLSSGDLAAVPDFHRYQVVLNTLLETLQGALPNPWFAVGQSTGGAILIDYLVQKSALQQASAFAQVALLAPLVRPRNWRLRGMLHALISVLKSHVLRKFTDNSNDYSFLIFLRERDPLQARYLSGQWVKALKRWSKVIVAQAPTNFAPLIVQGQQDGSVAWEENMVILRRLFPCAEITYLFNLRHQVVNEHPDLRHAVFDQVGRSFKASIWRP
jgi:lysophospholipase